MLRKFAEKCFVIIPAVGIVIIVSWHMYYGGLHPLEFRDNAYVADKTYIEKLEQAQKLITLKPEELEDIRIAGEKTLAATLKPEELALFPTAAEVADELKSRYGVVDQEALASFIVGVNHLASHEPHHAARLFRASLESHRTRAVHLALGYTLKVLGEDLASYEVYAALKEEAQDAENDTLLKRAYRLADPSTGQHNMMMGVGIMVGAGLSLFMALVMLGIWVRSMRRKRMGFTPNEWPSLRRVLYLKRIQSADNDEKLDLLEREVEEILSRRIDGFGGDDRPATLATVRVEADRLKSATQDRLIGEREYLSAVFLDAIAAHEQALRHYQNALRRLDLPSIHLAHGVSLSYQKKKGAARKELQKARERSEEIGATTEVSDRAARYLSET